MDEIDLDELYNDRDNPGWDLHGRYNEIYASKRNKKEPELRELSPADKEEFEAMKSDLDLFKIENESGEVSDARKKRNTAIGNAYGSIMKTFSKQNITKRDANLCLEEMRNALPVSSKAEYLQMVYWASRCLEYSQKENEGKSKKASNNVQTYKRYDLFVNIMKHSDNNNFYHLNRCVEEIEDLNLMTRFKIGFVNDAKKVSSDEKFQEKCHQKSAHLKEVETAETKKSIESFNRSQMYKQKLKNQYD